MVTGIFPTEIGTLNQLSAWVIMLLESIKTLVLTTCLVAELVEMAFTDVSGAVFETVANLRQLGKSSVPLISSCTAPHHPALFSWATPFRTENLDFVLTSVSGTIPSEIALNTNLRESAPLLP